MQTKPLYVLISDGGDGSYSTQYTFSTALIQKMHKADSDGKLDYGAVGVDGDGFHYKTLQVPVECTYESLGIMFPLEDDYLDQFNEEGDDE